VPPTPRRRCHRCHQAALVVEQRWQKSLLGIIPRSDCILELRCPSCRASVVLFPRSEIVAERILGCLLLPAIVPGIYFLTSARRKERTWVENPVVDVSVQ
jgi:hypothetical protein